MIELFDREGREAAFCRDGHSVYLWDGTPAAYITEDAVYAYSAAHRLDEGRLDLERGR